MTALSENPENPRDNIKGWERAVRAALWPVFEVLSLPWRVWWWSVKFRWWCGDVAALVARLVWEVRESLRRWRRRQWYRLRHPLVWWWINREAMIHADNELDWYERPPAPSPVPEPSAPAAAPDSKIPPPPPAPPPETRPAGVTLH